MKRGGTDLGILGLGQIGGSIAAALKRNRSPYRVFGYDSNSALCQTAKRRQLIHSIFDSDVDLTKNVDILVVALPMFGIHRLLRDNRRLLEDKVLVMDTGSTKQDVVGTARRLRLTNFIGGHPYAGTEKSAPDGWDANLFAGQLFFVVPPEDHSRMALKNAVELVEATGAVPRQIDPESHDRMFAFASGLPHVIAYALVASQSDERRRKKIEKDFLAHSFASSTRVAKSPPETIAQFLWQNRKHLKREIDIFRRKLDRFSEQLAMDEIDSFLEEIKRVKGLKDNLEQTNGSET